MNKSNPVCSKAAKSVRSLCIKRRLRQDSPLRFPPLFFNGPFNGGVSPPCSEPNSPGSLSTALQVLLTAGVGQLLSANTLQELAGKLLVQRERERKKQHQVARCKSHFHSGFHVSSALKSVLSRLALSAVSPAGPESVSVLK